MKFNEHFIHINRSHERYVRVFANGKIVFAFSRFTMKNNVLESENVFFKEMSLDSNSIASIVFAIREY